MAPIPMDQLSTIVTLVERKLKKNKNKKTSGNLPKAALIAIVVVVVVVLVVAIVLPIILRRRKARREAKRITGAKFSEMDSNGPYGQYGSGGMDSDGRGAVAYYHDGEREMPQRPLPSFALPK